MRLLHAYLAGVEARYEALRAGQSPHREWAARLATLGQAVTVHAPDASNVSVVGTFNGWNGAATPLAKSADGWWEARVTLEPGTYEFAYIIDGKCATPPEAIVTVEDGFGGRNGILEVLPPGR